MTAQAAGARASGRRTGSICSMAGPRPSVRLHRASTPRPNPTLSSRPPESDIRPRLAGLARENLTANSQQDRCRRSTPTFIATIFTPSGRPMSSCEVLSAKARARRVWSWYLDFPIGVDFNSFDVWTHRRFAFATGASVGCPPDPVFTKGQNWGFPPAPPRSSARIRLCLPDRVRSGRTISSTPMPCGWTM